MPIRVPVIDCTTDSDQRAGTFVESQLNSLPHWFGRRAADHQPILFLIGPPPPAEISDSPNSPFDPAPPVELDLHAIPHSGSHSESPLRSPSDPAPPVGWRIYLFERAHVRDLLRISHPNDKWHQAVYFDRASLIRRITLPDALIWFHDQRRTLPTPIRQLLPDPVAADVSPLQLTCSPAHLPHVREQPKHVEATVLRSPIDPALRVDWRNVARRGPGRLRLEPYKSLRRQKLIAHWHHAKSQGISQSKFCAQRGIQIPDLARAINWATKRRHRDHNYFRKKRDESPPP
jgi:hypothetical protein